MGAGQVAIGSLHTAEKNCEDSSVQAASPNFAARTHFSAW